MRKFILYTLLILLLLATVSLAYGFYNARQIRYFAKNAQGIIALNDFDGELQSIEKYFQQASNQDTKTLEENTAAYQVQLDALIKKTQNSLEEINHLRTPRFAAGTKGNLADYYTKAGEQAVVFKAIVGYINQISDISAVFEKMNDNSTLEDIQNLITEADSKSENISSDGLPPDLKSNAEQLTAAYKNYLSAINEAAASKNDNPQQLESAYADFSKSEDQFFTSARQYISGLENLDPLKNKINSELQNLGSVYFSLK